MKLREKPIFTEKENEGLKSKKQREK